MFRQWSNVLIYQDPADRLIATTIVHQAPLISADKTLATLSPLQILM